MRRFLSEFEPTSSTRILDVGGTDKNWVIANYAGDVVLLNLEIPRSAKRSSNFEYAAGDARDLPYPDGAFDIAFSNSVIEHLHTFENQQRFANEIRRVGRKLWVQTPARWFPFEPHWLTPFIHFFPKRLQRRLVRNFTVYGWVMRPNQPQVDDLIDEYRLLTYAEMKQLFPDCQIRRERCAGVTKAYVAVRNGS